ncbi:MFS transporter [Thermodesulfobacteriota bacterium]
MSDDRAIEHSALIVATVTSFMGPFLISAVNVALPAIQEEFSVDAVLLSWIATSYLLAVAVFLVPVGKIADIYGRKKIFLAGLIVYVSASFVAVLARSVQALIFYRIFQGLGAAMFVTTGMAIVTSIFPLERRGRAIGIYVAAVYIGLSTGPFIGGILTQQFGWRSIFLFVLPFGLASIGLTLKHLKGEWADARGEKFDLLGSIIYSLAIISLVYGASLLPDAWAVYLMAIGILGLFAFVWLELKVSVPVFEVRLFQNNRLFTFSSLAALINYAATFAVTFLLSLYLQYIKNLSPQNAGIILMAQPVVMAFFSPFAGRLSDKIEPRVLASTGMGITVLGLTHFIFLGPQTSTILIIATLIMLGFGFAIFSSPNMNAIMSSVEKKYFGIASGTVATMRLLGQMASMAVATVIFAIFIGRSEISPHNFDMFLKSMKIIFLIFSILCTAGIFFSLSRGQLRN